jgi:methionine synthase II (cobalamin-independent)
MRSSNLPYDCLFLNYFNESYGKHESLQKDQENQINELLKNLMKHYIRFLSIFIPK